MKSLDLRTHLGSAAATNAAHLSARPDGGHIEAWHATWRLQDLLEALASASSVVSPGNQLELLHAVASDTLEVALTLFGHGHSLVWWALCGRQAKQT